MTSRWLADNPSKRWCEQFFLAYSLVWVGGLLGIVVPLGIYEVSLPLPPLFTCPS
jgi:cycloeucalenol cycloisomerase